MRTIPETIEFIQRVHAGQFDKGGQPYWLHPVAVMRRLGPTVSLRAQLGALLHDVVEDTDETIETLAARGYSGGELTIVRLLSHNLGAGTYFDRIHRIVASGDTDAMLVELSDNQENSDPARIALIPDPEEQERATKRATQRYAPSIGILRQGLETFGVSVPWELGGSAPAL